MTFHQQEYEIDKKGDIPSIGVNDVDNLSIVEPVEPSKFKRIYRSALVSSATPLAPTQPFKLTISILACPYSSRWCALSSVGFESIALLTPSPIPASLPSTVRRRRPRFHRASHGRRHQWSRRRRFVF